VGAGEGGYVVHRARSEPGTFAIAIDASPDGLARGSWRAKRARLANAAFLIEGIERVSDDLSDLAHEVTVHFPWGSLLRGLVAPDASVVGRLARLLRPGGELRALLSATPRDGYPEITPARLIALRHAYASFGLELIDVRAAGSNEIVESRSAWAKRLGSGRPVALARYSRRRGSSHATSAGSSSRRIGSSVEI
jgi:16S rRNA (adenine(1408)-N(1))-methyltransferase